MKKRFIVIFILLSCMKLFSIGIHAGINKSYLNHLEDEPKFGYTVGLAFDIKFIHIETNYVNRRFQIENLEYYTQNDEIYKCSIKGNLEYLQIPVLARFYSFHIKSCKINFLAGYGFSLCVDDHSEVFNKILQYEFQPGEKKGELPRAEVNYDKWSYPADNSTSGYQIAIELQKSRMKWGIKCSFETNGYLGTLDYIVVGKGKFLIMTSYFQLYF